MFAVFSLLAYKEIAYTVESVLTNKTVTFSSISLKIATWFRN